MYALTAAGMRYMDQYTVRSGIMSSVLMENASRGVADVVTSEFPDTHTSVLVLAGPGNNGGDAVCTARILLNKGYDVTLHFAGNIDAVTPEFKRQLDIFTKAFPNVELAGLRGMNATVLQRHYDVIIDGIFGIGLKKPIKGDTSRMIQYVNARKNCCRIAIDIPSGLHATTGRVMGVAFKADITVTFGNCKTGMFFGRGREFCGDVRTVDIGLLRAGYSRITDKMTICDRAFFNATYRNNVLPRKEHSHKGTYGTVGIVASTNGMLGASMLAAKAAYRAGCGLVKIFCHTKQVGFFNVSVPEAVAVPYRNDDILGELNDFCRTVDVILIGPGLNEDSVGRLLVKQVLAGKKPVVFDAGALNIIAHNLKSFRKRKCPCVLTPHLGEMARLCNEEVSIVSDKRVAYTKKFSEKFNVSMAVKADVTLLSLADGKGGEKLFINTTGNSGLATAGSGDVLAGVIASLIAQGNGLNTSLLYGTMIHGISAERFARDAESKRKMMAGDIIDNLF